MADYIAKWHKELGIFCRIKPLIIVEGNVTRKPEKKELPRGTHVCMLPIAVNRRYKNHDGAETDEVSYFDIETYGSLADACEKWCPKGRGVRVVGRLKQSRWTSDDGKQRSRVTIIAEHLEFKPFFQKKDDNTEEKLEENLRAIIAEIVKNKPNGVKGAFVKSVNLSSTMSPGFKIDKNSLGL